MQYLNINHSQLALGAYSGLSSALVPNWIANYNTINQNQLVFKYGIFEKNQMSSLYLDNYGDSLTQNMIYLGVCLLAIVLSKCTRTENLVTSVFGRFYAIALGMFLSNVFGQIQSQILFSTLQILKTNLLLNFYSGASYFMAYFTMTSIIGLQIFTFFKLKTIFASKERLKKLHNQDIQDDLKARWTEKRFELLFDSFKEGNKYTFFFTYWTTVFNTVYILSILIFQPVPVLQCLSVFLLILGFILFSAFVKPMKKRATALSYFFNLGCMLVAALVNMAQAISETLSEQAVDSSFGKAMYFIIMINTGVNLLFGFAGIGLGICTLISRRLKRSKIAKENSQVIELNNKGTLKESNPEISMDSNLNARKFASHCLESSQIKEDETAPNQQSTQDEFGNHRLKFIHKKEKGLSRTNYRSRRSMSARPSQFLANIDYGDRTPS
jgi:hypothetical protein